MKRALLAVLVTLFLLAWLPAAAGAAPTPVRGAAADPTEVQAVAPSALVAGVVTTLAATLQDTATGAPVAGANLSFDLQTTFGWLSLGVVRTNAQGRGGVSYEPAAGGTYAVRVSFAGNASLGPSNTTLSLTVLAASAAPAPLIPTDRAIVLVVVAVVGGVWATYGFVAFLVLGIRSAGLRSEEEEFESEEKETMEEAPSDAEASPKRVPGAANANRAVIGLAVAALVLAGASVGLIAVGGLSHTAAYTPTTVELQVTVLADFRGAGYDSFVPNELVVHAGDTVKITVYNVDPDMDHGFKIDALGINQGIPAASLDTTTGEITPTVTPVPAFTVTTAGAYVWYCTVPCGPGHSTMTGTLVVLPD